MFSAFHLGFSVVVIGFFSVFWGDSVAYFHPKMSNFENTAVSSLN